MNIFKLGLSFTMYKLYMTMNINEYLKMVGEFAYIVARVSALCMPIIRFRDNRDGQTQYIFFNMR